MKWVCATLLCSLMLVALRGELVKEITRLQQAGFFSDLSIDDKLFLTRMTAAAEACKLTALINDLGKDNLVRVLSHLPMNDSQQIGAYMTSHQLSEAMGTCTMQ